jgi:hypothetical protein
VAGGGVARPHATEPPAGPPDNSDVRSRDTSIRWSAEGRPLTVEAQRFRHPSMEMDMEQDRAQRRFSEGEEQLPDSPEKRHVGRFSEGEEQLPDTPEKRHVGRFSEGQEELPDSPRKRHVGRFGDGEERSS